MTVRIAIVGDLDLGKASHRDLDAARTALGPDVEAAWIPTDGARVQDLGHVDGIWLAPGSPYADDAGALAAVRTARKLGIPFLATCGGMQYAVMEFCRDVLGLTARHAEIDGAGPDTVIEPLSCSLVGQERLVTPVPGTAFATLTGGRPFPGLHYCSFGPSAATLGMLQRNGWVIEATAPDAPAEVLTYTWHSFFVTTLFQPQAGAAEGRALHPIVHTFVALARRRALAREQRETWAAYEQQVAAYDALPRPYVHQMRTSRYRWWRPLLALGIGMAVSMLAMMVALVPVGLMYSDPFGRGVSDEPLVVLSLNLSIAAFIPGAIAATAWGHGRPVGRLFSVVGRLRWRWTLRAIALITPLWALYVAGSWYLSGAHMLRRPSHVFFLLVIALLTTPLQTTGEEVFFRGLLPQAVGAWIRRPVVALVVTTVISTVTFALAHGSLDPWTLIDIGSLAVAGCYLWWRTGGLEGGIAIHTVNNLLVTFAGLIVGGMDQSYVTSSTKGDPLSTLTSVTVTALATALVLWDGKRQGLVPTKRGAPARG